MKDNNPEQLETESQEPQERVIRNASPNQDETEDQAPSGASSRSTLINDAHGDKSELNHVVEDISETRPVKADNGHLELKPLMQDGITETGEADPKNNQERRRWFKYNWRYLLPWNFCWKE